MVLSFLQSWKDGEHPFHVFLDFFLILPRERGQFEILHDGEVPEEAASLRNMGDSQLADNFFRFVLEHILAHKGHLGSLFHLHHSGDGPQGRALACPIGPDDADDLPLIYLEIDTVEGLDVPIRNPKIFYLQQHYSTSSFPR